MQEHAAGLARWTTEESDVARDSGLAARREGERKGCGGWWWPWPRGR
jgi:hypothetical protein